MCSEVFGRGKGYCTGELQKDSLHGEDNCGKVPRPSIYDLEIYLFSTASREHAPELEPDENTSEGQRKTKDPEKQSCAHASNTSGDGRWCREDTTANHAADAEGRISSWSL